MKTATLLTPLDFAEAVPAGRRRFWKQILPVTSIDYDGQKIHFDPDFHKNLELAYADKVYDQIPLVFADGGNAHNEDPRNFGGEIKQMVNRGDGGTWALIEADRAAAKAIRANPKLGVSARIVQGVNKNGKQYGAAVRHVLMTMFPRVQGMEPWQAVDLAEVADVEVVDLTAESFEQEDGAMGTKTAKTKAKVPGQQVDLSALSDVEFQQFLDLAEKGGLAVADPDEELDEGDLDDPAEGEDDDEGEGEGSEPKAKKKKSKKVVTIENESEEEGTDDEGDGATDLSDRHDPRFTQFLTQHAKDQWGTTREGYVNKGVPPFLVDLAQPILSQPEVIDLSDGDGNKTSSHKIIRSMLDGMANIVDLTGEAGHQIDLSSVKDDEADAFVKAWTKDYR